ncbi:MAG TPA: cupin domain-containing protein [Solirubrobacteraceae bacterium]|nr:cupin domain-containing protein [Solirubrobacteraceae bacterium]
MADEPSPGGAAPAGAAPPPRRVVTAHDRAGRGVIRGDGPPPASRRLADGTIFHDLWTTAASPPSIAATEPEPIGAGEPLGPPPAGTRVRIVDLPPGARSPMHRTESVDYGVVLEGEVTLVLDGGSDTTLGPGELIVQRGTDHAWENRSAGWTRILFVLVAGRFEGTLRAQLPPDAVTHDV